MGGKPPLAAGLCGPGVGRRIWRQGQGPWVQEGTRGQKLWAEEERSWPHVLRKHPRGIQVPGICGESLDPRN